MITILQHGENVPAGTITEYLNAHNESFRILRLYEQDKLPDNPPEKLIILGGQMSVNDENLYPFLSAEKKLVRVAIERDCTVLGICLGAQMIATACGKRVFADEKEIGWRTIYGCSPAWQQVFPTSFEVFHWHAETFELPEGANLLAKGDVVTNQAFIIHNAVGIQFHPEVTAPVIATWLRDLNDTMRLPLLKEVEKRIEGYRQLSITILDAFCTCWNKQTGWKP